MSRSSVCLPVLNGLLYIPLPLSSLSLILQRLPLSSKTRVLKIQNKSNIEILFIKPSYAENYILLLFMGGAWVNTRIHYEAQATLQLTILLP